MFNNVGEKCMRLAKVCCWLGIVFSVLLGIILIIIAGSLKDQDSSSLIINGFMLLIGGPILSWLGSLSLYAIGETAENSAIAANLAVKADMERNQNKQNVEA